MYSDELSPERFSGFVWIISVLLKYFYALFTMEVYSACCVEHKAFCCGPSLAIPVVSLSFPLFLPLRREEKLINIIEMDDLAIISSKEVL